MGSNLIIKSCKGVYSGIRNLTRNNITVPNFTSTMGKSIATDVVNLSKTCTIDLSRYSPEINSKFSEFVAILKSRNPKQITDSKRYSQILEHIFNNPNYKSEKDLLTHLKYLTTLAGKKAPDGKFLLDGKTFNYLADFKANGLSKTRLREYGELICCAEQGLIHPSALQKFNIANGVNPEILRDIEKIKLAKAEGKELIDAFIPEFESVVKNADEIAKLKPGDFFSVKKGYSGGRPDVYYVTGKNSIHSMGELNRQILFDLLPPVKRFFVKQHGSGTCYQLSAYIAMFNEPKFMSKLLGRISKHNEKLMIKMPDGSTPNNLFAGKFEEFSSTGCVRTYLENGKFKATDPSQSVLSNPLIKAMESLYGKHRKYTFADEFVKSIYKIKGKDVAKRAYKEAFDNMERYIYIKDNGGNFTVKTIEEINKKQIKLGKKTFKTVEDYYKEAGEVDEIFNYFNKGYNKVNSYHSGGSSNSTVLNEMRKNFQKPDTVHIFGTIPKRTGMESGLNVNRDIYSSHGYCVQNYNPKTDIVTYINPWNSCLTYEMRLEELAQYIDDIASFV